MTSISYFKISFIINSLLAIQSTFAQQVSYAESSLRQFNVIDPEQVGFIRVQLGELTHAINSDEYMSKPINIENLLTPEEKETLCDQKYASYNDNSQMCSCYGTVSREFRPTSNLMCNIKGSCLARKGVVYDGGCYCGEIYNRQTRINPSTQRCSTSKGLTIGEIVDVSEEDIQNPIIQMRTTNKRSVHDLLERKIKNCEILGGHYKNNNCFCHHFRQNNPLALIGFNSVDYDQSYRPTLSNQQYTATSESFNFSYAGNLYCSNHYDQQGWVRFPMSQSGTFIQRQRVIWPEIGLIALQQDIEKMVFISNLPGVKRVTSARSLFAQCCVNTLGSAVSNENYPLFMHPKTGLLYCAHSNITNCSRSMVR